MLQRDQLRAIADKYPASVALDGAEDYVYLASSRVNLQLTQERYPDLKFLETREVH